MLKLLLVGAGNMGFALAEGIQSKGKYELHVFDVHASKVDDLKNQVAIKVHTTIPQNVTFDILVICIKPQDLIEVSSWMAKVCHPKTLLISILAGQSIEGLRSVTKHGGPIVRAMPNIAAKVHQAATAVSFCHLCSSQDQSIGRDIFESIGSVVEIKEYLMDAVTGLSGSGPAYIYMIIEALIDGGVKMGLTRAVSHDLVVQTVIGSASLVKASGIHPAVLKDQVTTPGGTTIHAIHALESKGLRSILIDAVQTATEKSKALRQG
jgi:pyrroline-5-carboxylate reductase